MKKAFITPEVKFFRVHNTDTICTSEIPVDGSGEAPVPGRMFFDGENVSADGY